MAINKIMHKLSESTVQLAQRHATQAQEHGKSIEACGKTLQYRNQTAQEYGHFIEEYGKVVQEYAQQSLMYVKKNFGGGEVIIDTVTYGKAVEAHIKATQAQITAVKMYTEAVRERLKTNNRSSTKKEK